MPAARVVYAWRSQHAADGTARHQVTWSLVGANGEWVCGSGSEGYRNKPDAQRAVARVAELLGGDLEWQVKGGALRQVGPGKRPE